MEGMIEKYNLSKNEIAAVGDTVVDIPLLKGLVYL